MFPQSLLQLLVDASNLRLVSGNFSSPGSAHREIPAHLPMHRRLSAAWSRKWPPNWVSQPERRFLPGQQTHRQLCFGMGIVSSGQAFISQGTGSNIGLCVTEPRPNRHRHLHSPRNPRALDAVGGDDLHRRLNEMVCQPAQCNGERFCRKQ